MKHSTSAASTRVASIAILISNASTFLPRYSGVRPTIRPAMKTARMAYISIPYRPAPTPPKITSPVMMFAIGTRPPSGVNESCMELTAPQEASVVTVANRAERAMPKRISLPSMLPPLSPSTLARVFDALRGDQRVALAPPACRRRETPTRNRKPIAPQSAQPCLALPTYRPNV